MKIKLADAADVREDKVTDVEVEGQPVILVRHGEAIAAYLNRCPHADGTLYRDGKVLRCEWHGATFSPERGQALSGPARTGTRLRRVPVVVEDGEVFYDDGA